MDEQVIARAAHIVADMPEEVAHDTGDMIAATRAGVEFDAKAEFVARFGHHRQRVVGGFVAGHLGDGPLVVAYRTIIER